MTEEKQDIIQAFIKVGCPCSNNGYYLYDIQKWLREVKFIHIQPERDEDYWKPALYEFKNGNKYISIGFKNYNTYEEALEAGIWESYYLLSN